MRSDWVLELLGVARGDDRHVATVVVLSRTAIIGDKKQGGAKTSQCNESAIAPPRPIIFGLCLIVTAWKVSFQLKQHDQQFAVVDVPGTTITTAPQWRAAVR